MNPEVCASRGAIFGISVSPRISLTLDLATTN
jgi:hypothetical protein